MLEKGICRPSNSPWAFPIVMVRKPDQSIRPCFDARRLNDITRKDSYTLPRIQDLLQQFRGAESFSVGDASSGYWQVPLAQESIPKAAFITRWGLYEFLVMPFGLVNSGATFQRLMDMVLGNMRWDRGHVYVDDIIIYSPTWEQHLIDLDEFLKRCIDMGITLKLSKCQFGQTHVKYLGHRVTKNGHTMDPDKIKAVMDTQPPKNVSELRTVLGLFGHYRQYIRNYADIVEPLAAMTRQAQDTYHWKKGKPRKKPRKRENTTPAREWQWTKLEQDTFDLIKTKLTQAPILAHPDLSGQYPFKLETDASNIGTGAVLIQQLPDGDKVIGYYSYCLKPNERKWSTTEREAYAALLGMRNFRHLISGCHFTLVTDHIALRYLRNMKDPHGRIARWLMEMQQYDHEVDHRAGNLNVVADALSRAPVVHAVDNKQEEVNTTVYATTTPAPPITPTTMTSPAPPVTVNTESSGDMPLRLPPKKNIIALQQQDPIMNAYVQYLTTKTLKNVPDDIRPLLLDLDKYAVIHGVLYHIWTIRSPNRRKQVRVQLVVPPTMRPAILKAHHDNILAGHRGVNATYELIRKNYFWVNMLADIHEYIQSCETCANVKTPHRGDQGRQPVYPCRE